jgi:hypothetical protein
MPDLPLACPRCGTDMRGGRLSSAIGPSAIVLRWQAAYVVRWVGDAGTGGRMHEHVGWLCPEMCGEFVPVRERGNG